MRRLACLLGLAGCDAVFDLEPLEPVSSLCLGGGLFEHCLGMQPPAELDRIDIDTSDDAMCTEIVAQGDVDQTEVCIVAARNIELDAPLIAHGQRPLVLAAIDTFEITITGSVSVASKRRLVNGAGSNFPRCANRLAGPNATGLSGGGGGAGGSYQTLGGRGGRGNGGVAIATPTPDSMPGFVRGGCQGGDGGSATLANGGGRGAGGGAVYIMAGREIRIAGVIDASGEAGAGGAGGTASTSGGGGGGGGGAGGMIGLDAPIITLASTAILIANGGGGGGGGSSTQQGIQGAESESTAPFPFVAAGGLGGSSNAGGKGGVGAAIAPAGDGLDYAPNAGGAAGGGGGGGTGFIRWFSARVTDEGAAISPPAS